MIITTIFSKQPAAWLHARLAALYTLPSGVLSAWMPRAPYLIHRSKRNILTAVCFALVFVRPGPGTDQKVRLWFVPNSMLLLGLSCWILSLYFGFRSYQLAGMAHELSASYPAPQFNWLPRLAPVLVFIAFFIGPLRIEKAFISEELRKKLTEDPE